MNEKKKFIVQSKWEKIRTTDIYQAAYLLAKGSVIEDIELTRELDKDLCILVLTSKTIISDRESYINNQALIEPSLYQKALNRIRDVVFKAVDHAKKNADQGGAL